MAYSSDINLGLDQAPKTTNTDLLPDMIQVYNAIHILAQATDQVRGGLGGGEPGTPPWESMPFRNWFYAPCGVAVKAGMMVCVIHEYTTGNPHNYWETWDGGDDSTLISGVVPGIPRAQSSVGIPGFRNITPGFTRFMGFALEDCERGGMVKVGVPPAIIQVEDIPIGTTLWSWPWDVRGDRARVFKGKLSPVQLQGWTTIDNMMPVGQAVDTNAVYIFPTIDHFSYPGEYSGNPEAGGA